MNRLICDTRFLIEMPDRETDKVKSYRVDHYSDVLENTEKMFGAIATVTNYLVNFLDDNDLVVHILIVVRRLYNFFPKYRKELEKVMTSVFVAVLRNFKRAAEANQKANGSNYTSKQFDLAKRIYESTQLFVTFLLESDHTDPELKAKIEQNDALKFYLLDKNRYGKFDKNMVSDFKRHKYILKPMSFRNLVAEFGHMTTVEIAAGGTYRIPLDIQVPGSILCISFQTLVA